jgi:hypothetical protein
VLDQVADDPTLARTPPPAAAPPPAEARAPVLAPPGMRRFRGRPVGG